MGKTESRQKMQKAVNGTIDVVNKARSAHSKPELNSLIGAISCPTSCAIANNLPMRNKVQAHGIFVRSAKQAKLLADVLGTNFEKVTAPKKGMKDFKYYARHNSTTTEFMRYFDTGTVKDLSTSKVLGKTSIQWVNGWTGAIESKVVDLVEVSDDRATTDTLELSVSDATKLVKAIF